MAETQKIDIVDAFKAQVKSLLKDSKLKEAIVFVGSKYEAAEYQSLTSVR